MVAQRAEYVLGVDVGGTYIRMGVVSRDLELRDFRMVLTQTLYGDEDPKDPVRELIDSIKRYGAEWENELIALSIGFPSIISKDKRTIYSSPNLPGFDRVPIADLLEREFRIPIFVDNDVNHLLLYDIQRLDLFHEEILRVSISAPDWATPSISPGNCSAAKTERPRSLAIFPSCTAMIRAAAGTPAALSCTPPGKGCRRFAGSIFRIPISGMFLSSTAVRA